MTTSRHLSRLANSTSLTTLLVAACLVVLLPNGSQAAEAVKGGGPAVSVQGTESAAAKANETKAAPAAAGRMQQLSGQSTADELRAKQQKLEADNKAIDAAMKEARDKAGTAMDAATREMAIGVAGGTAAKAAGAAGLGTPAAQGHAQHTQSGLFAGIAGLVAQRDDLSRALVNLLASTGDTLAKKQDALARESELKTKRVQLDQLDKQILDQLGTIRKSSQLEAQTAQERMKGLQDQSEARLKEQAQKAKEARDDGKSANLFGTIFGGQLIGTVIGKEIAGQADNVQRAKAAEAQAVKTGIAILAAQHDDKTREISRLQAEVQKTKGSKADELKAEMSALAAQRNKLNESIGAQSAELRKVKEAERGAAEGQLKQISSMQDVVKREAAEREAASKKGKAADRAEAQKDMQQLKALQEALNGSASAQKKALSQIAAEQSEVAKREALQKKIAEGLRANPGKLDALIIPKDSGKGGAQAGGKGGVAGYAGLTAEALAGGKGRGADDAVVKALKQIQDKVAEKSSGGGTKGKIDSQIGNINTQKQQGSGKDAADQLRAAQEKKDQAASAVAGSDKKSGLSSKIDQQVKINERQAGSGSDKKTGLSSKIEQQVKINERQAGSGSDKKSGLSSKIEQQVKINERQAGSGSDKKTGSKANEALKAAQEQQRMATTGAKAADQVKRMEEATKQRMDQLKAKPQVISAPCPNPPCNVMQQRAPSAGTGAMDRLGGGPSPAVQAAKAGLGAKPQANAATKNESSQLKAVDIQKATQQRQQSMQDMQKKQSESSGAMMRKLP